MAIEGIGRQLSLVTESGSFKNKFKTLEEAKAAAQGNSYNQTLKTGSEVIVKNKDGNYSIYSLTNEMSALVKSLSTTTDPVKKAEIKKQLVELGLDAGAKNSASFSPVEFTLSSSESIRIEKDYVNGVGSQINDAYLGGKNLFATKESAEAIAKKMPGIKAIIQGEDGYVIYRATPEEMSKLTSGAVNCDPKIVSLVSESNKPINIIRQSNDNHGVGTIPATPQPTQTSQGTSTIPVIPPTNNADNNTPANPGDTTSNPHVDSTSVPDPDFENHYKFPEFTLKDPTSSFGIKYGTGSLLDFSYRLNEPFSLRSDYMFPDFSDFMYNLNPSNTPSPTVNTNDTEIKNANTVLSTGAIKDLIKTDTKINKLEDLPPSLKELAKNDLSKANEILTGAIGKVKLGQELSSEELAFLSIPLKGIDTSTITDSKAKESIDSLKGSCNKIADSYNSLAVKVDPKILGRVEDDISAKIGEHILDKVLPFLNREEQLNKISTILSDSTLSNKQKLEKLSSNCDIAGLEQFSESNISGITSFEKTISQIDKIKSAKPNYVYQDSLYNAKLVTKGMTVGLNLSADQITETDFEAAKAKKIQQNKEVIDRVATDFQTKTSEIANQINTPQNIQTLKSSFANVTGDIDMTKVDQAVLESLMSSKMRELASGDKSNRPATQVMISQIKDGTRKISDITKDEILAMVKEDTQSSLSKIKSDGPTTLDSGDIMRLSLFSDNLLSKEGLDDKTKKVISDLKGKGVELSKQLNNVSYANSFLATKQEQISSQTSGITKNSYISASDFDTLNYSIDKNYFDSKDFSFIKPEDVKDLNQIHELNIKIDGTNEELKEQGNQVKSQIKEVKKKLSQIPKTEQNTQIRNTLLAQISALGDLKDALLNPAMSLDERNSKLNSAKNAEKQVNSLKEAIETFNKSELEKMIDSLNPTESEAVIQIRKLDIEIDEDNKDLTEQVGQVQSQINEVQKVLDKIPKTDANRRIRDLLTSQIAALKELKTALSNRDMPVADKKLKLNAAKRAEMQTNNFKKAILAINSLDKNDPDYKKKAALIMNVCIEANAYIESIEVNDKDFELKATSITTALEKDINTIKQTKQKEIAINGGSEVAKTAEKEKIVRKKNPEPKVSEDEAIGIATSLPPSLGPWIERTSPIDYDKIEAAFSLALKIRELQKQRQDIYDNSSDAVKKAVDALGYMKDDPIGLYTATKDDDKEFKPGEKDLSVGAQMKDTIRQNEIAAINAEADFADADNIDTSAASVTGLLRKFREIIVALDIDSANIKKSVGSRTGIDRKFSETLKENRARWSQLDEAKKEYETHFKSSSEVQKPALPPSLENAFDKLDKAKAESIKISSRLEVLVNKYNQALENSQRPDPKLCVELTQQLNSYSSNEKKNDKLFAEVDTLINRR